MIKAVIFDCFGVLTRDGWREYIHQKPPDIQKKLHELTQLRGAGKLTRPDFVIAAAEIADDSQENLSRHSAPVNDKNTVLLDYIKVLKGDNYTIGLLSNVGSNWIREQLLNIDEQKLFDDMTLSYEVGMVKPDPRFYALSAQRLSIPLEQCVLIDDVESYCQGAKDVGMQAIQYQNFGQFKVELEKLIL